jgi:WD repeat-containing protein 35
LIDIYYRMEDFENLLKLVASLPENSPILENLGDKFVSVGICEGAVQSYVRLGNVKKAIDACILLNQWNQAVELAEQHNFL